MKTDITSIFHNLPVSAIQVLPVFPFPESPGIYNTHILAASPFPGPPYALSTLSVNPL
jgi:hypothetical protein